MTTKSIQNLIQSGDLSGITTYQAGIAQTMMHRQLQKQCDEILKPYGITKIQWFLIGAVLEAGPTGIRVTELARTLGTTLPYVTTAINTLELKHMLTRRDHQDDSRAKVVRVHPDFVPRCSDIERTLRQGLRESIYKHISPQDFRVYMKVLYQLSNLSASHQ